MTRFLVVEDDPATQALLTYYLQDEGVVEVAATVAKAREALRDADVAFIDHHLPDGTGLSLLKETADRARGPAMVMLTGAGDEELAVQAMKAGAFDYATKEGLNQARMLRLARSAREHAALRRSLQEGLARLHQRERDLELYAAAVAHDLRAPLQGIRATVELVMLLHQEDLSPDVTGRLSRTNRSVERMAAMLDALMDYARAGEEARPGPADVSVVMKAVHQDLGPIAELGGHRVTVGALPVVDASPDRVRGVLQNLVDNAMKHAGRPVHIRVTAESQRQNWLIHVDDDGPGIPPTHTERMFALFGRGQDAQDKAGVGLGLALCRKLAELDGGSLTHVPRPVGSRFTLRLRGAG